MTTNDYGGFLGTLGENKSQAQLMVRAAMLFLCSLSVSLPTLFGLVYKLQVKNYSESSASIVTLSQNSCAGQDPTWSVFVPVGCVRVAAMGYLDMHREIENNGFVSYLILFIVGSMATIVVCIHFVRYRGIIQSTPELRSQARLDIHKKEMDRALVAVRAELSSQLQTTRDEVSDLRKSLPTTALTYE
jgi:hypothetical protein